MTTKAQRTRTRSIDYSNKNTLRPNERQYLSETEKDDRTYGERVDDRLKLDTGGAKAIRKTCSQDGGSNGRPTWGDITKESEEMQIEALKERLTRS